MKSYERFLAAVSCVFLALLLFCLAAKQTPVANASTAALAISPDVVPAGVTKAADCTCLHACECLADCHCEPAAPALMVALADCPAPAPCPPDCPGNGDPPNALPIIPVGPSLPAQRE